MDKESESGRVTCKYKESKRESYMSVQREGEKDWEKNELKEESEKNHV